MPATRETLEARMIARRARKLGGGPVQLAETLAGLSSTLEGEDLIEALAFGGWATERQARAYVAALEARA